jgi:hypothetical protein
LVVSISFPEKWNILNSKRIPRLPNLNYNLYDISFIYSFFILLIYLNSMTNVNNQIKIFLTIKKFFDISNVMTYFFKLRKRKTKYLINKLKFS